MIKAPFFLILFLFFFRVSIKAQFFSDSVLHYGIQLKVPASNYHWGWSSGVFLNAIIHEYQKEVSADKVECLNYIKKAMDVNYNVANGFSPNDVISGAGMAFLARITKEEKYRKKAFDIYNDFLKIPRASNGGISHRFNTIELWDDTIYMIGVYLFEMYRLTGDEKYIDVFMEQYFIHKKKLADKHWHLWYHGWDADNQNHDDSCCMLGWADNPGRRSKEFWGRGNGWIMMAIADALEAIPASYRYRKILQHDLILMTEKLPALQNQETGLWYQLPIYPMDSLNFQESSCSAMFSYAILKGIKTHLLPPDIFKPVVEKAFAGLKKFCIRKTGDNYLVPDRVCEGTCIGNKMYYYKRKSVDAEDFGIGVFVMAASDYERYCQY